MIDEVDKPCLAMIAISMHRLWPAGSSLPASWPPHRRPAQTRPAAPSLTSSTACKKPECCAKAKKPLERTTSCDSPAQVSHS